MINKYTLLISIICITNIANAATYKSTQDALKDIFNTGGEIIQAPTLFDQKLITKLRILNQKLNSYIMDKQGILVGKLSKEGTVESDNIFDVWHKGLYSRVDMLIEILENTMKKERSKKYPYSSLAQLEHWDTTKTFNDDVIKKAQKIQRSTLLEQKRKIAEITIRFAEFIADVNTKAIKDYKSM